MPPPSLPPPGGFQLDLLCVIARLEQIAREREFGRYSFAEWLLDERVIKCDLPRLRSYLTDETQAWQARIDELLDTEDGRR